MVDAGAAGDLADAVPVGVLFQVDRYLSGDFDGRVAARLVGPAGTGPVRKRAGAGHARSVDQPELPLVWSPTISVTPPPYGVFSHHTPGETASQVAARIDNYRPHLDSAAWTAIEAFVRDAVHQAGPTTPYNASDLLHAVTYLTVWVWTLGQPVTADNVFDRWTIERFIAEGAPATWSNPTRGNRRSMLFRVAEAIHGDIGHDSIAPLPPSDPAAPYTPAELAAFRGWARHQATATMRRDAAVLLALGAGAGLAVEDLLPLHTRDITIGVDGIVSVNVQGRRRRIVTMLPDWSALLVDAATGGHPDDWVFRRGRSGSFKNGVGNFLAKTTGLVKPNSQRLRSTWIVHHLATGTHARHLLHEAGVQSATALIRYLRFVPGIEQDAARRRLRSEATE